MTTKARKYFCIGIMIGIASTTISVLAEWTRSQMWPKGLAWVDLGAQAVLGGVVLGLLGSILGRRQDNREPRR